MTSSTDEAIFQRLLDDPAVVGAFSMTVDGIVQLSHGDLANPAASQLAPSIRKLLQDVKGLLDQVPPVTNKAGVRAPDGFKRVSSTFPAEYSGSIIQIIWLVAGMCLPLWPPLTTSPIHPLSQST